MPLLVGLVVLCGLAGTAGAAAALAGLGVLRGPPPGDAATAALVATSTCAALAAAAFRTRDGMGAASAIGASWAPILVITGALRAWEAPDAREAAHTGLTALVPAPALAPALALADGFFPAVKAPPVARAQRVEPAPPPRSPARGSDDEVVLPYEGTGHSLVVQVGFATARGDALDIGMLFDTGATLTTLDRATLRRLGVVVPSDAPVIDLHTANGPARVPVVRVPRLWLGGFPVYDVTVGVCEPCADAGVAGLLGLNVTGRFLVTLDAQLQEITLVPRATSRGPVLDLQPWLDLDARITRWPDGRTEAEVTARNAAPREVASAEVLLRCGDADDAAQDADDPGASWLASLGAIPAGGTAVTTVRIPADEAPDPGCDTWRVRLHGGRW